MKFFESTRGKIIAGAAAGLLLLTLVVSCSRPAYNPGYAGIPVAQPQYAPQVAPTVVAPAPVVVQSGGGSHLGETIVGSTIGTMIGNHLTRDRTPVQQVAPPAPVYQPRPVYTTPSPAYTAPAQRYTAPTTRTTVTSRPSGGTSIRVGKTR